MRPRPVVTVLRVESKVWTLMVMPARKTRRLSDFSWEQTTWTCASGKAKELDLGGSLGIQEGRRWDGILPS